MTNELRQRIVALYEAGMDVNEICWETEALKGDVRNEISIATNNSIEEVLRCHRRTSQDTLYCKHQLNRGARA
jgi:hypothetical protein